MDPGELWSIGDYAIVGDLWGEPGRDLANTLDVADHDIGVFDVIDLATGTGPGLRVSQLAIRHFRVLHPLQFAGCGARRDGVTERDIRWFSRSVPAGLGSVFQP